MQKYFDLKERVEKLRREADKAEGALEQTVKQLEKEFDCFTLEEAEEKLTLMKKDELRAKKKFEKSLREFETKWPEEEL